MAQTGCWLTDETVLKELKSFFQDVDQGFSQYYEEQFGTQEPMLDGILGEKLRTKELLNLHLKRINRKRNRNNLPLLHLDCRHITHAEKTHGADMGLLLHLEVPNEQNLQKAVLVQSKRLYPDQGNIFSENSLYRYLFGEQASKESSKLEPQWQRMLNVTPSSVYFLYGPEKFLSRNGKYPELGIRVISAQTIAGIYNASLPGRLFTAYNAYEMAVPFSQWMVENFICCNVGDSSQAAIETALGRNPNLRVKSSLEIIISTNQNQLELNLWNQ